MFPRLCVTLLTTGSLGVQSEVTAYAPLPISSPDRSIVDMRIDEVLERPLRYNQHGLSYYIQSTGATKVVLKQHHPLTGDTVLNVSTGILHALHLKPTIEQRLDLHLTFSLSIYNEAEEMIKLAVVKS